MRKMIGKVAAAFAVLAFATPAMALDIGQCLAMADMNAAMKTQGQQSLFIADTVDYDGQRETAAGITQTRAEWRDMWQKLQSDPAYRKKLRDKFRAEGRSQEEIDASLRKLIEATAILKNGDPDAPVPRYMIVIASNASGSVGYIVAGDHPLDQVSSKACIQGRLTNVKLAPPGILTGNAAAELLSADADIFQPNGMRLSHIPIRVFRSAIGRKGTIIATNPDGSTPAIYNLAGLKLRPAATGQGAN